MRNKLAAISLSLVVVGLLTVSVPLFAHHGNAAYDFDKTVTLKGTVTEWMFANPHCFIKLDVKDDNGNVQHWTIETGAAAYGAQNGWSKNTLKAGDQVTIDIMPVKNGGHVGRTRRLILPDGTILKGDTRFTI